MTTAVRPAAPAPTGPPNLNASTGAGQRRPTARRRSWRWLRFVAPLVVVTLLWLVTGIAHWYQEPNLADPGTLSPYGAGRHGSSQLADRLRASGIRIDRVTSGVAAVDAATEGDATIFLPTPDYLEPRILSQLAVAPGRHRIVLVHPGRRAIAYSPVPADVRRSRFATATVAPSCAADYATRAGPAAVGRDTYDADRPTTSCYGGSLIGFAATDREFIYVGATDPFRNDRIGEAGNAMLATGLLSQFDRVVWVDLHRTELGPTATGSPEGPNQPTADPYRRNDQDRTNTGIALLDAFPVQLWAGMAVILVGAMLFALARARRLGPPVAEPLPVLVPAAETVTGRGRLYAHIAAREASLDALRAAAIGRIARVLDPLASAAPERELAAPGPAADRLVAQIAARVDVPDAAIHTVLYGPPPSDDDDLVQAAADLDRLVTAVVWDRPDPTSPHRSGGTL